VEVGKTRFIDFDGSSPTNAAAAVKTSTNVLN